MKRLEALNAALGCAWRRGVLPEPVLESERLIESAARAEAAPASALATIPAEPLERLLASLRDEARLSPLGRTMAWGQIVKILRERLRAHRLWDRRPAILDRPIAAPIVILGQMRSGTTRLHRLLACDPQFAHSRFFEVLNPVPPLRGPDLRPAKAWIGLHALRLLNPALGPIHPTSARAAEEEFGLFSFSLYGAQLEAQWHVPGFARYWEARDRSGVYREFRALLQTMAHARGADPARPWLLKAPQFMEDLHDLLRTFPDARLICLHRDTRQVVASSASLVWNQMRIQSDHVSRAWVGAEWSRKTARRDSVSRHVRQAHPQVPQIDVDFAAMNADWRQEVQRIYRFLGLALQPAVLARMARYLHRAERSGFRAHRYRAEDFGLPRQDDPLAA